MKFIPYGNARWKRKLVVTLLIAAFPMTFVVNGVISYRSLISFSSELTSVPVPSILIPGNASRLSEMAAEFEFYLERDHLPLNYTLTVYWNDLFTEISAFGTAGDAAIWTGMTLAMAAYKYATMKRDGNSTQVQDALDLVHRMIFGVSLLLAIPNGGIGPRYAGVLARSVSPKNWSTTNPPIAGYDYTSHADNRDVFDGKGDYSDWMWIGYPSLDQYSGIVMGITVAAALVDDSWVQDQVRLLAAQIIEHFRHTNWRLTDGNSPGTSRTTGQSFHYKIQISSFWLLGVLFMGKLTDPTRYTSLFNHFAFERGYADRLALYSDLRMFSLFNYYSMNINWVILHGMAAFETHPYLHALFGNLFENTLYPVIQGHRNAWFNMAYLQVTGKNLPSVQDDVVDQLMRFDIERIPGQANTTRLPERGLNVTGNYHDLVNESWERMRFDEWLETKWYFPNARLNLGSLFMDASQEYLAKPKTVEHYQCVDFLWQRTPWEEYDYSPARRQDSGLSFLLPYYMARYCGFLEEG
ncbi:hypothetical protein GF325_07070 [Candidatus Bathyarchaeota archaeon]|nr:hypothetical protein [Candidatus Bathyarchaeota archaeon]